MTDRTLFNATCRNVHGLRPWAASWAISMQRRMAK
ncbi:hypothetical protein GXY_01646 [Novacetimonas hansenii ATCC 23769]|uniref:Uncharacterized protein n=1 Tax=Novacetimonas hansenii ATCC 23769 TaxID=714995 RepID=D5QB38_NOVHA|nr:hypothetical protein GXY_01646 [Novacetimonas hansenii ATCC 23769]